MKKCLSRRVSFGCLSGFILTFPVTICQGSVLYSENFDSVALGANKEEGITTGDGVRAPQTAVWSGEAPTGWTVDDSLMQGLGSPDTDGVVEWAGWSFTDQRWWAYTAGNQNRANFAKGGGAIAVTDPDEWDDLTRSGPYNSFLVSPVIPLAAAGGADVMLRFDSSWRPETPQKALILVSWDGGAFTEVLRWVGDPADEAHFHADAENETFYLPLTPPVGAQNVRLRFGTIDAGNNWWWAVDNISLYTGAEPPRFESHPVSPAGVTQVGSSATVAIGSPLDLAVTLAAEPDAATLQWVRMNGAVRTVLTGETGESLSLASPALTDSGDYLCEATNAAGTVKSAPLKVKVAGFTITQQPVATAVAAGEPASLSLMAESSSALVYQWFKGEEATRVEVPGQTGPSLDFLTTVMDDAGLYSVRITSTDLGVSEFSALARLEVLPLRIDQAPASLDALEGGEASFEVMATGQSLTYQWLFRAPGQTGDPTPVSGAVMSSLLVSPVTRFGGGYYSVKITSALGTLTSPEAKLTVQAEAAPNDIFTENWQSVVLGPNVEEGIQTGAGFPQPALPAVWSPTAPNGWTIDNSAMPVPAPGNESATDGVKEWYGWTFTEPTWWSQTAEGQGRAGFSKGIGDSAETGVPAVIAVADTDEWDDLTHTAGSFRSSLISPAISLAGTVPGSVVLVFDSSWQREAPMKAKVEVALDGGAFQQVMIWTPDGPDQHNDNTDETVGIPLLTTAANTSLKVSFTLFDAGNNWWWAVDNIRVTAVTNAAPVDPPVITALNYDAGTKVATVKWKSVPLRPYKLQHSRDLQTWLTAVPGLVGAAGAESETSVDVDTLFPTPPTPDRLYFRVSE